MNATARSALEPRCGTKCQVILTSRSQRERQKTAALRDRSESIALDAFHLIVDKRGSVLECASPLALSAREPQCGTRYRVFSRLVSSESGRGLSLSGTVRSPSGWGALHPVVDERESSRVKSPTIGHPVSHSQRMKVPT